MSHIICFGHKSVLEDSYTSKVAEEKFSTIILQILTITMNKNVSVVV